MYERDNLQGIYSMRDNSMRNKKILWIEKERKLSGYGAGHHRYYQQLTGVFPCSYVHGL
jgi:hypothetical protein